MKNLTPKLVICIVAFTLALALALAVLTLWPRPDYSITHYKQITGYPGAVCLHPYIQANGRPACGNGAPYTTSSVNAGEGYGLWVGCHQYGDPYACEQLHD